jgi:hypothetical protein
MKARELLHIYRRRQAGYEKGLLKYGPALYGAVCSLVDRLAQFSGDEEIRIDVERGDGVFVLAATGVEIARLPTGAVGEDLDGGAG